MDPKIWQWTTALKLFINSPTYGSDLITAQLVAAAELTPYLLITNIHSQISANPIDHQRADLALILPMLNYEQLTIYVSLWSECCACETGTNQLFSLYWKNSHAEKACTHELKTTFAHAINDYLYQQALHLANVATELASVVVGGSVTSGSPSWCRSTKPA
jgi:hypothetical protein